ncbi:hypothetical protein JKP88DRAFT_348401 [Tribonema minus]|uniref:Prolyl 4-hydroxylase alpha subunit domain-containing protein n=1 Tax=Tribonema minus TaxID=303371 RepID=A0A836CGT5_9STRA|nr:hypothetical protein JKP88DRAFT_348401 [Tribonema minus]
MRSLLLSLCLVATIGFAKVHRHPDEVFLAFENEPIQAKNGMAINSFRGHSFVAHKADRTLTHFDPDTDASPDAVFFTMSDWGDTITLTSNKDGSLALTQMNSYLQVKDQMAAAADKCKRKRNLKDDTAVLDKHLLKCISDIMAKQVAPLRQCTVLKCISDIMAKQVAPLDKELSKQYKMMNEVGERVRNYTCIDPKMETTEPPLRTTKWSGHAVKVFLEESDSQIMLIDNFVSDAECDALIAAGTDTLEAATVAGQTQRDKSAARRAMAGIAEPNHSAKPGDDPVTDLYRRAYKFANDQTGYKMAVEGQENFSVIKYDTTDEYISHCDGGCNGGPYKLGGRVATMVMYCEAAKAGGGTTFANVDVFVKGKKGQAVFFSYYDSEKERVDNGRTRHSGCPVIEGTKWIATLWMRKGVSKSVPWERFDPQGRPLRREEWDDPVDEDSEDFEDFEGHEDYEPADDEYWDEEEEEEEQEL